MANPKLSIGMAHYDDFDGVYFTIQALRMYHREVMKDVEIVIVDNSPKSNSSQHVKNFMRGGPGGVGLAGVQYMEMHDMVGTSPSREAIFKVATGDAVMVIDCHILLAPGSVKQLIEFYDQHPDTNDLYSGPLVYDTMQNLATHMNDIWRAEMWGVWGAAWKCGCGPDGVEFSVTEAPGEKEVMTSARLLLPGYVPVSSCRACKKEIPSIPWTQHENNLFMMGYRPKGHNPDEEPFEIPGMGLGLFSCRREAWLGFNPHSRGFGGEELYIHGKYRANGYRSMCLPFLKWVHRFSRPSGVRYPITRWNKVRNYVLEFNELGWDLNPVYEHFVESGLMKREAWDALVEDPIKHIKDPTECSTCGDKSARSEDATKSIKDIDEAFDTVKKIDRDLNEHMPKIRELAGLVEHVTEISNRRESAIAILAARPKTFKSYNTEPDALFNRMVKTLPDCKVESSQLSSPDIAEIEPTEMLFIDSHHTYIQLSEELRKYAGSVKRFIVMHDTQIHGERGEDGGPGLLVAVREFCLENPKWSVVYHTTNQYGLTVLGRLKQDKPSMPSTIQMAKNLIGTLKEHVADGMNKVARDILERRLEICSICEHRVDKRCSVCGCFIDKKAAMSVSECPLGFWHKVEK